MEAWDPLKTGCVEGVSGQPRGMGFDLSSRSEETGADCVPDWRHRGAPRWLARAARFPQHWEYKLIAPSHLIKRAPPRNLTADGPEVFRRNLSRRSPKTFVATMMERPI